MSENQAASGDGSETSASPAIKLKQIEFSKKTSLESLDIMIAAAQRVLDLRTDSGDTISSLYSPHDGLLVEIRNILQNAISNTEFEFNLS